MYSVIVRPEVFESFKVEDSIYCSPEFVSMVSRDALAAEKGVDADPDSKFDFSDDEQEALHKKGFETGEVAE